MGHLFACRLYFDFVLWRQEGSPPYHGFEVLEFEPEAPAHGTFTMYQATSQKIAELVQALNLPEARPNDIPTMLSAYDTRCSEWSDLERGLRSDLVSRSTASHDFNWSCL